MQSWDCNMDCIGTVLSVRGANYPLTIYSQGVVTKHLQHVILCSVLTLYCCSILTLYLGLGFETGINNCDWDWDWKLEFIIESGIGI